MQTPSSIARIFVAVLFVSLVATAFAGPINCATDPSNPACAPTAVLSWHLAQNNAPIHPISTGPATWNPTGFWEMTLGGSNGPFEFSGGVLQSSADPFISYSLGSISNTTGLDVIYSFDFTTPFSGGPYVTAVTFFGDSLLHTNFFDGNTSSVTPVPANGYIQNSLVDGVLIPNFQLGKGCTTTPFFCTSPDVGALAKVYFSPASGTLEITGQFIVTNNSNYAPQGATYLLPIPEPASLLLFGSGILALGGLVRRKMNL